MYYILMETGYEYNDETYNPPECGGGKPRSVYKDRAKAVAEATKCNAKHFEEGMRPGDYGYDWDDVTSFDEGEIILRMLDIDPHFKMTKSPWEMGGLPALTPAQQLKAAELFDLIKFYEVFEVEGNE